jgi:hypothetical protein
MATCAVCNEAYTIMFEAGIPICVQCADELDAKREKAERNPLSVIQDRTRAASG